MTGNSIRLERATAADLDRVETLLDDNGLPTDVRGGPPRFFVARCDGALVGVGGLECHGPDGLLRSVVVPEPHRGERYGTALCDALEARARADGVRTLYLLTTTAAGFFRARGYETVPREAAPASIRNTSEFADLCPDSATCMRTELGRQDGRGQPCSRS